MKGVIVWSILVTCVTATDGGSEVRDTGAQTKGPGFYHYDLVVLAVILAIKFKAVLLVLAVIFGVGTYYKLFTGFGNYYKGFKCQPPIIYDSHHKYNYDHEPPYGHSERRDRSDDFTKYSENLDFELLATVMKGIGLQDLSFNITDKANVPCRRRLVCEADRLISTNPVVGYVINLLRGLSRYRTSQSAKLRGYSCAELHPRCISIRGSQEHLKKTQKTSGINLQNRKE